MAQLGVSYEAMRGTWKARVHHLGREFLIGRYATSLEAALAHDLVARGINSHPATRRPKPLNYPDTLHHDPTAAAKLQQILAAADAAAVNAGQPSHNVAALGDAGSFAAAQECLFDGMLLLLPQEQQQQQPVVHPSTTTGKRSRASTPQHGRQRRPAERAASEPLLGTRTAAQAAGAAAAAEAATVAAAAAVGAAFKRAQLLPPLSAPAVAAGSLGLGAPAATVPTPAGAAVAASLARALSEPLASEQQPEPPPMLDAAELGCEDFSDLLTLLLGEEGVDSMHTPAAAVQPQPQPPPQQAPPQAPGQLDSPSSGTSVTDSVRPAWAAAGAVAAKAPGAGTSI